MRKYLRRGHTIGELWQEWSLDHFSGDLSYSSLATALATQGASPEQLTRWSVFRQRYEAQRFGGQVQSGAAEEQDTEDFIRLLSAWDEMMGRDRDRLPVQLDRFDRELPSNYGRGWRWFWHRRLALALGLCLLASAAMLVISGWWGWCDAQSVPASKRAQQAFWHGDLVAAERAIQEAYVSNGRGAWRDYNLGCLAWQRGQYMQSHYLFSRACWNDGGSCPEYVQAWRDSAAKLKLNSWEPPRHSGFVVPCWLWSSASFLALCFWVRRRPRLFAFTACLAGVGLVWIALSWCQPSVIMINGEGRLHSGPGYRFPALAPVRMGALAAIQQEKAGYVCLQTVVGQEEFYEADTVLPEVWLPLEGIARLD